GVQRAADVVVQVRPLGHRLQKCDQRRLIPPRLRKPPRRRPLIRPRRRGKKQEEGERQASSSPGLKPRTVRDKTRRRGLGMSNPRRWVSSRTDPDFNPGAPATPRERKQDIHSGLLAAQPPLSYRGRRGC